MCCVVGTARFTSRVVGPLCIPTSSEWACLFPHSCHQDVLSYFLANLIGENGIHVLICISLITNEFEHFTCLRAILFFFQVSSDHLFLIARFLVLCLSFFKNSSHFRNISPLCHVQNSLLVCSCFFLFVYDNFFLTRKFFFNIYVVIFISLLLALGFEL